MVFLLSCSKYKIENVENLAENVPEKTDSAENKFDEKSPFAENSKNKDEEKKWLEQVFKCKNGKGFCFYLAQEEKITTPLFYQFMLDSEQIFGASSLTEKEIPTAIKKYKEKWFKIYPLRKEMEPWLFGRGQDDMENIQNVKIEKISDLKYRVFVQYDESFKTLNEVILVPNKNKFLIDYCSTEFLE